MGNFDRPVPFRGNWVDTFPLPRIYFQPNRDTIDVEDQFSLKSLFNPCRIHAVFY